MFVTWDPWGPRHPGMATTHFSLIPLLSTLSCRQKGVSFPKLTSISPATYFASYTSTVEVYNWRRLEMTMEGWLDKVGSR